MANSIVSICNLALGWVAANRIISLEDNSVEAQLCRENYESGRKAVLEAVPWTFATHRAQLSPLVGSPVFGYANAFQVPADCLKVTWASDQPQDEEKRTNTLRWKKEGVNILADTGTLYILYNIDETDPNKFSNLFVHTLAARMAADFAIPLTHSRKLQADMWRLYELKLRDAAGSDGQQGRNERLRFRQLTNVR